MSATRSIYKVIRSVLFSVILSAVGCVVMLYVLLSLPPVQNALRIRAEKELSSLLGAKVSVSEVDIYPFNELRMHGVSVYAPDGRRCISAGTLGAGIELYKLFTTGEVVITYAEIVSLNALIEQKAPGAPLNIQFLIDAFKTDNKKKKADIKVVLHNVVIRKSMVAWHRQWLPPDKDRSRIDPNHIELYNLNADLSFPEIRGRDIELKLRRLAFLEKSGLDVKSLAVDVSVTPSKISFSKFRLKVGSSDLTVSDQSLDMEGNADLMKALIKESRSVGITASPLYLSDFSPLVPQFGKINERFHLQAGLYGTPDNVLVNDFRLSSESGDCGAGMSGSLTGLMNPSELKADLKTFRLNMPAMMVSGLLACLPSMPDNLRRSIMSLGDVAVEAAGFADLSDRAARLRAKLSTSAGDVEASGAFGWKNSGFMAKEVMVNTEAFDLSELFPALPLGRFALEAGGEVTINGKSLEGDVMITLPFMEYNGTRLQSITANGRKTGNDIQIELASSDPAVMLMADLDATLEGAASHWNAGVEISRLDLSTLGIANAAKIKGVSGIVSAHLQGNNPDNLQGKAEVSGLNVNLGDKTLTLNRLAADAEIGETFRRYSVVSDWFDTELKGNFRIANMIEMTRGLLAEAFPVFINRPKKSDAAGQSAEWKMDIKPGGELFTFINSPVRPGVPITLYGDFDGDSRKIKIDIEAPYLIKGRNKIIKNTGLRASLSESDLFALHLVTSYPLKHDTGDFKFTLSGGTGAFSGALGWVMESDRANRGEISLGGSIAGDTFGGRPAVSVRIEPSGFSLNGAEWTISPASVVYGDRQLLVEGLKVAHGLQFVTVSGKASSNPADILTARLAGIDLQYIFDILDINHVDFGGIATGEAMVSNLFSGKPIARTTGLHARNLAYNNCVLGDADLEGYWDNDRKMVGINADIEDHDVARAKVRGGVYVQKDSLSFDFDAHHVDIRMLQPFMSGFTSSVTGRATGKLKLFGTFSDIDLVGRAFADTITMKVDHTNVCYSGSDSVIFNPGRIVIPGIRLYDRYGHSGYLTGEVRHDFLRDAVFDFELTKARSLLVLDTHKSKDAFWNGHVLADGEASLSGMPGSVSLDIRMTTAPGSEFTISLDETQTATEYTFLTFSDSSKPARVESRDSLTFEERFMKEAEDVRMRPSLFALDLSLGVTPDANLVLVMDPATGDRIRANGNGALQLHYDSDSDDFTVYGKYTLNKGNYNFSLQDLILKNFSIRPGSAISFNGDPMDARLDIAAAYRVNANLAELDQSFKDDPDLTRTSVPVDALLKVTGDINTPEIRFDISLPTVTSEVERKLRSLVSTDDMMNRQVIYLLALNRFYPASTYSGGDRGGELASVASSTLSSQIQNIIGSITDKFSLAPSIKSEKSDLSDMEFDVALSSSLFDNRLLINGNLGYRDKSTSQTTFVGDFDVEYLLNRSGRLRLKAYNHFNDASYYLKSALTTQGIGVVYRHDFDRPFTFIRRLFNRKKEHSGKTGGNEKKGKQKKTE